MLLRSYAIVAAYGGPRSRFTACLGVAVLAAAAAAILPGSGVGAQEAAVRAPFRTLSSVKAAALNEISGCAVSRQTPGGARVVWLHNDSGDSARMFAVDAATGRVRTTYSVTGAAAQDWEDVAIAGGNLYIGDIGDNAAARDSVVIYRVPEPMLSAKATASAVSTAAAVALRLRYPDGSHNAEALLVHPTTGDVYVVTKTVDGRSAVYALRKAAALPPGDYALEKVADLTLDRESLIFPNQITAGDISPTGDRIVLRTYQYLYVYRPSSGGAFDTAWTVAPKQVESPLLLQAEAVCFTPDGRFVLTTQEGLPAPIVQIDLRGI